MADAVRRLSHHPGLSRSLRIWCARQLSAAGLVPAPEARTASAMSLDQSVRGTVDIVRIPDGPGAWICAANGHVFGARGPDVVRVLDHLRDSTIVQVTDLCPENSDGVLSLVRRLNALRAIDVMA